MAAGGRPLGLDIVELFIAVEDAFQIHIEDHEAQEVATAGDLSLLVISKLKAPDSSRCLTSVAFYRTRRALMTVLGVARREVAPSTRLDALLPADNRAARWRRVEEAAGLKLPKLQLAGSIQLTLLTVGVATTLYPAIRSGAGIVWMALLAVTGLVLGAGLMRLAAPLAVNFPFPDPTVGALAKAVLALNYGNLATEIGGWSEAEVWDVVCQLIVRQTGVERERITPEARLVDDLGID